MSVERSFPRAATKDGEGHARSGYYIQCGGCGTIKSVLAAGHKQVLPPEVLAKKFKQAGWTLGRSARHDFCPECTKAKNSVSDARRRQHIAAIRKSPPPPKEEPVKHTPTLVDIRAAVAATPAEPTREQRRLILRDLENSYLDEKRGYADGFSDKMIADTLKMPVAWVAKLREENYGPVRINDQSVAFAVSVKEIEEKMFALSAEIANAVKHVEDLRGKQRVLSDQLAALVKQARVIERLY